VMARACGGLARTMVKGVEKDMPIAASDRQPQGPGVDGGDEIDRPRSTEAADSPLYRPATARGKNEADLDRRATRPNSPLLRAQSGFRRRQSLGSARALVQWKGRPGGLLAFWERRSDATGVWRGTIAPRRRKTRLRCKQSLGGGPVRPAGSETTKASPVGWVVWAVPIVFFPVCREKVPPAFGHGAERP